MDRIGFLSSLYLIIKPCQGKYLSNYRSMIYVWTEDDGWIAGRIDSGGTAQHPDELSLSTKTGQRRTKHGKMQIVQKGQGRFIRRLLFTL